MGNVIAKIINTMTEPSNLAEKHNIECKPDIGGGLEKIFSIIGETRGGGNFGNKMSNNSATDSSGGSPTSRVQAEKQTWNLLKTYLLAVRERLTLVIGSCFNH